MTEYRTPYKLVKEFHETYGQAVRDTPNVEIPEKLLRVNLIVEESEEYAEADAANDFIEIVDALADLVYVSEGALISHGIPTQSKFGRIENDCAPLEVTKPNINVFDREKNGDMIRESVQKYVRFIEDGSQDTKILGKLIDNIIDSCYLVSRSFGVDLDKILLEVQRSNMSKLGADGKPIYRESDNKVLKGPNFSEPNIAVELEKQGWVK